MRLGSAPGRAQADPCPRIRARVSPAGFPRSAQAPCSPRSPSPRGRTQQPRTPAHRNTSLRSPRCRGWGAAGPRGRPFPSADRLPVPARSRPPPRRLPHGPPRGRAGSPRPALRSRPAQPLARRPLPERRRQQGLRAARALMAAYPTGSQAPAPQQRGEGLPRRCGKRGGPM